MYHRPPLLIINNLFRDGVISFRKKYKLLLRREKELTIGDLTPWTLYYIRIRACNAGGCGETPTALEVRSAAEIAEEVPGPTLLVGAGGKPQMFASKPGKPMNSIAGLKYRCETG